MKRATSFRRWSVAMIVIVAALVAVKVGRNLTPSAAAPVDSTRFDAQRPVITRLVGKNHTLTISSTGKGAVYSVADQQGKTLLSGASADQLKQAHPELYRMINSGTADADRAVIDASVARD